MTDISESYHAFWSAFQSDSVSTIDSIYNDSVLPACMHSALSARQTGAVQECVYNSDCESTFCNDGKVLRLSLEQVECYISRQRETLMHANQTGCCYIQVYVLKVVADCYGT